MLNEAIIRKEQHNSRNIFVFYKVNLREAPSVPTTASQRFEDVIIEVVMVVSVVLRSDERGR